MWRAKQVENIGQNALLEPGGDRLKTIELVISISKNYLSALKNRYLFIEHHDSVHIASHVANPAVNNDQHTDNELLTWISAG